MGKVIKVIDLLNEMAKDNKIPKKIIYRGEKYHANIFKTNYFDDRDNSLLDFQSLNDEVEILEDEEQEIDIQGIKELLEQENLSYYDDVEIKHNRIRINEQTKAIKQLDLRLKKLERNN